MANSNGKIIHYIAAARLPTQRAHGLQIMKMCEAFARSGAQVELIIPRRSNEIDEDPFTYYQVEKDFRIKKLWTVSLFSHREPRKKIFYVIEMITFAWSVFWYAALHTHGIFYFRFDRVLCLALFPFLKKRSTTCEAHFFIEGWWQKLLLRCENIIVVNKEAKRRYDHVVDLEEKVLIAPDGVSLKDFTVTESKETLRRKLGLPQEKKIVLYSGYFYLWKGIETIVQAAEFLSDDTLIVLIGGAREDIKPIQDLIQEKKFTNIMLIKHQPHRMMPKYQKAADCLLIGGTMSSQKSAYFTSPLKLFEYMASCVPIIAPRTPALEEILRHRENAYFVNPDDPSALAKGIKKIFAQHRLADAIAQQARQDVSIYQWEKRAKNILDFMQRRAEAMRVLYLFAGARRWMIEAWKKGFMADSQLVGLNHLWKYKIRARYYETPFMNKLRKIQFHLAQFAALEEMRHHDVVFLGSNLFFVFFVKYILRWNKPKLIFYNTSLTNTLKRNKKGVRAWVVQKAIQLCDIIICPSVAQKRYLESRGFDASKIIFVPNGVDAKFFKPYTAVGAGQKPFILAIGKDMGRDYHTLIKAVGPLSVPVVIIAASRNLLGINNIPLHATVRYNVPQYETLRYYHDAVFVVVPTFSQDRLDASDCSGQYVMLEAMAAGKALIVSERDTLEGYIEHGVHALVVPSEEPEALHCAMRHLLNHPEVISTMERTNRKMVETYFTSECLARSLSQIFQNLRTYAA